MVKGYQMYLIPFLSCQTSSHLVHLLGVLAYETMDNVTKLFSRLLYFLCLNNGDKLDTATLELMAWIKIVNADITL